MWNVRCEIIISHHTLHTSHYFPKLSFGMLVKVKAPFA